MTNVMLALLMGIPALIAVFLFVMAGILLCAPELLTGVVLHGMAAGCLAAGAVLLLPLLTGGVTWLLAGRRKNRERKQNREMENRPEPRA